MYHPPVPVDADSLTGEGVLQNMFPLALPVKLYVNYVGTLTLFEVTAVKEDSDVVVEVTGTEQPIDVKFEEVKLYVFRIKGIVMKGSIFTTCVIVRQINMELKLMNISNEISKSFIFCFHR